MLDLCVMVLEIVVLVSIVVAVVKRFVRDDRRPLARPIVRPLQHDKHEAPIVESSNMRPAGPPEVAANQPTQQVEATPTGRVRNVRLGRKILHLEELARGDKIVTRVSRVNQDGKQQGKAKEQQAPIEDAARMLVKR